MRATRTARFIVATLVCTLLFVGVVPPRPAFAVGSDVAHSPPSGITTSVTFRGDYDQSPPSPCVNSAAVIDADDATCWGRGNDDLYNDARNGAYVQFINGAGGIGSVDLLSFRLKWGVCQYGFSWNHGGCSSNGDYGAAPDVTHWYLYCDDGSGNPYDDPLLYDSGTVALAGGTIGAFDTGQLNFDQACVSPDAGTVRVTLLYSTDSAGDGHPAWGNGQALVISSFEVYDASSTLPAPDFEEYVYGLRISHPFFAREISWFWAKSYAGSWSLTDGDDDELAGQAGPAGATADTPEYVRISCPIVCGHDVYTITVCEVGYECATYEIDSDDDGYLIAPAGSAILSSVIGCYNLTTNQCADPRDAAADSAGVTFTLVTAIAGRDARGTVSFGRADMSADGCEFVGSFTTTAELDPDATYTQIIAAWDQGAGSFSIDGDQLWLVRWDSTRNDSQTCKIVAVDVTTGGVDTIRVTPVSTTTPCTNDFLCAIQDAAGAAEDIWTEKVDDLAALATSKEPFASVGRAYVGVTTQIVALQNELDDADDCPGIEIDVDMEAVFPSMLPDDTPHLEFALLPCSWFTFLVDSTLPGTSTHWWGAFTTMLSPLLWVGFAFQQLRRLQPKTQL